MCVCVCVCVFIDIALAFEKKNGERNEERKKERKKEMGLVRPAAGMFYCHHIPVPADAISLLEKSIFT